MANGYQGSVQDWLASLVGANGKDGLSAYEIAVKNGYAGTEIEWLRSLAGANGKSAYELAVDNGYNGDLSSWLESLVGASGEDGKSAYELAVANGYKGTETEWLATLIGPSGAAGAAGRDGEDGKSAYELAVANGYEGTESQWLVYLIGPAGADGKSAYEIAVDNGFIGDVDAWLTSLIGEKGEKGDKGDKGDTGAPGADGKDGANGADGKSAYQIAVDNGFVGSQQDWLASLEGEKGESGTSVTNAYINDKLHLIMVLSNGTEIDAGYVGVSSGGGSSETYTVTFKDYNGATLKTETVAKGGSATPPANPTREGYTFVGWSGSYSNVTADVVVVAQYKQVETVVKTYTVIFVDHDGSTLKTQVVEEGQNATAPADPSREGYTFTGWDKAFTNITSDLVVTAQYQEIPSTDLTVSAGRATAAPGDTVQIAISLKNNPGIVSMTLRMVYDESVMTLTKVTRGTALGEMTFTTPKDLKSGCQFPWDAEFVSPEDATNGDILVLTFTISETAAPGNYTLSLVTVGDIIDNDLNPVAVVLKNGGITIQ